MAGRRRSERELDADLARLFGLMINEGWSWSDLQTLTFGQLNLFVEAMNERNKRVARAMKAP